MYNNLSLIKKFNILSLILLLFCLGVLGSWVSAQIESRVLARVGYTTSIFTGSVIAPSVMEMIHQGNPEKGEKIEQILLSSGLGEEIVSLKVWDERGRIIHSTNPSEIGGIFPLEAGLEAAWTGIVSSEISSLDREEHLLQRETSDILIETYSPIRESGTGNIIAVVEFYQNADPIIEELRNARIQSWGISFFIILIIYFSLVLLVGRGNKTIIRQRKELEQRLEEYQGLLEKNIELHNRSLHSAARVTDLNERFLRRLAGELHDGPAQDISYALLTVDQINLASNTTENPEDTSSRLKNALERSLSEIRTISSGLRSPELDKLSIQDVVERAVRIHKNRTGSKVSLQIDPLPEIGALASKITLFRMLQESLANAYRHGRDNMPEVAVAGKNNYLHVEVKDRGPGIPGSPSLIEGDHMGLQVMRERIELLGGEMNIVRREPRGTIIVAKIPLGVGRQING